jgi:hypothetical protein
MSDHDPVIAKVRKANTKWLNLASLGVVLLGLASMINAVDDWYDSRNADRRINHLNELVLELNHETACRFDVNQEVEVIQAEIFTELALGLAAFAEEGGESAELLEHTTNIRQLSAELTRAVEARSEGVEDCRRESDVHKPEEE